MRISVLTETAQYKFKTARECRKEINARLHIFSGALIDLILRAFADERVLAIYIERVKIYES